MFEIVSLKLVPNSKLTISNTFPFKIIYKCNQNTIVNAFNSLLQLSSSSKQHLPPLVEDGDSPCDEDEQLPDINRPRGHASGRGIHSSKTVSIVQFYLAI